MGQDPLQVSQTQPIHFDKIVDEIKAQRPPEKRGRGRPPKNSVGGATNACTGGQAHSASGSAFHTPNSEAALNASGGAANAQAMLSSGIPHKALVNTLQIPFAVAAVQSKFEGFALKKDEAENMAPLLDHCIAQYLPSMAGPHAVAWMLGMGLATTALSKYFAYADWKKSPKANAARDFPNPKPEEVV